jgi:ArsR family transcriptional regulator, arsenate/arsenite/antimonite-responsive transcriptional repressor
MNDIVDVFKALSDPTRVRVLLLLRDRDLCVCEIMYVLGMEQSRVSHQMRALRQAGLVEDIREGRWINYRIAAAARPLLDGLFAGPLRDRIEAAPQTAADTRKLEECLRENVRRACLAQKAPASRLPAGLRCAGPGRPSGKKTRKGKRS